MILYTEWTDFAESQGKIFIKSRVLSVLSAAKRPCPKFLITAIPNEPKPEIAKLVKSLVNLRQSFSEAPSYGFS